MKLIDITCPKCGAALKPELNKEAVLCEYCGTTLGIEKEDSLEDISAKAEARAYGYYKGQMRAKAEEKAARKRIPNKVKVPLLVIGVLIFIGSLAWTVTELTKPVINPFDCIAVSFQGADGKGSVVLKPTHAVEGVDINHIDFHISKDNFLSEDDSISIDASSKYYRLEEKTKVYIVGGLNKYLTDLDNISEESLEMIDRKMRTSLEGNLAAAKDAGCLVEMKPVKLFLSTNGQKRNKLYEVFEVSFETKDGQKTYYVSAYYEGVVVSEENRVIISGTYGICFGYPKRVTDTVEICGHDSMSGVRTEIYLDEISGLEIKELDL